MLHFYKACTKQNILGSRESIQHEIFEWALGIKPDNEKHCAPSWLRIDNNPGCYFNIYNEMIQFVDFAYKYKNKHSLNCFDVVMLRYNTNFSSALKLINQHFQLGLGGQRPINIEFKEKYTPILKSKTTETVAIKRKTWTKPKYKLGITDFSNSDLNYWADYNISKELLDEYRVKKLVSYMKDFSFVNYSTSDDPIYAYLFNNLWDEKDTACKLYRPKTTDKGNKWRTNTNKYHIQGLEQIYNDIKLIDGDNVIYKEGNKLFLYSYLANIKRLRDDLTTLVITKSLKDIMTLRSLGYWAIAPQAEGNNIPNKVISMLDKTFDDIYILYDNDQAGMQASDKLSEKTGYLQVYLPKEFAKDISDCVKDHGVQFTQDIIDKLTNGE